MFKKIILGLVIVFGLIQFIRPPLNNGNADGMNDITHELDVPDSVMSILKVACYDCHSNKSNYPWYSKITPVNWWMHDHIVEGKKQLNFSEFTTYEQNRKEKFMHEIEGTVEEHYMPLDSYLWMHEEARLSKEQREMIMRWAREKLQATSGTQ